MFFPSVNLLCYNRGMTRILDMEPMQDEEYVERTLRPQKN